ncbi:uncharacterized protein K441DRAFT_653212, partial [Cenococcum geophilum 1.58]|uniref:uncharacterized protein n=1 Tax=Cenococcum geophilum 1.58 TaxID=794803 RepID=UPI00358E1792
ATRIECDLNNEALEQPLRRTRWGPDEPESLSIETLPDQLTEGRAKCICKH